MKRKIWVFVLGLLVAALISVCACAAPVSLPASMEVPADDVAMPALAQLPASLLVIEDGAFEGTALESVQLPEGLASVGDRAFAGIPTLRMIRVPDSVTVIGREVLAGSGRALVLASASSYAHSWARANSYPYAPIASWVADAAQPASGIACAQARNDTLPDQTLRSEDDGSAGSAGRSFAEVKADTCTGHLAQNVRGRFFP